MPNARERGAPDIIRSPVDAYQLCINLVNSASSEIMLLLPSPMLGQEIMRSTLKSLEEAAGRGVSVKILTTASTKLPVNGGIAVRRVAKECGEDLQEILIADRKGSLEYCIKDGRDTVSIYSSSPSTAKSFVAMFDNLWEQAVAYEKFKEVDQFKDEFINITAHLRMPIMPILGGLELIELKLRGVDSSVKEELGH